MKIFFPLASFFFPLLFVATEGLAIISPPFASQEDLAGGRGVIAVALPLPPKPVSPQPFFSRQLLMGVPF